MDESLKREVRQRALQRCEYCQIPERCYRSPFQIDHIIAKQHGGQTELENLAFCCFRCNVQKGPNIAGIDPETRLLAPLFHPRLQKWAEHFRWSGAVLIGLSPTGRATIATLGINRPTYIAVRESLIAEGVFPPGTGARG